MLVSSWVACGEAKGGGGGLIHTPGVFWMIGWEDKWGRMWCDECMWVGVVVWFRGNVCVCVDRDGEVRERGGGKWEVEGG